MGLFTQKPEEKTAWAVLPGEPLDAEDAAGTLDATSSVDPLDIGLGAQVTSIAFAVAPVLEDAADQTDAEPEDPSDD